MKVLMLNGSPHEKGCTYTALAEVGAKRRKNRKAETFRSNHIRCPHPLFY